MQFRFSGLPLASQEKHLADILSDSLPSENGLADGEQMVSIWSTDGEQMVSKKRREHDVKGGAQENCRFRANWLRTEASEQRGQEDDGELRFPVIHI